MSFGLRSVAVEGHTGSRRLRHRDRVDLDEELRPGQPGHADERVGGLVVSE
jgi:hypothetical protein